MSDTKNTENESGGLKKSLRLIYVYAIAAGLFSPLSDIGIPFSMNIVVRVHF